ncbi:unnamed protein product [Allacma fusca]|uniref:Uncharacterized protein n=1 Tax=Allacma fusca TaxID=39272 RepID=A0A8J2NWY0_9HEXA|nr:unnamed protein product [Allacma fusca]
MRHFSEIIEMQDGPKCFPATTDMILPCNLKVYKIYSKLWHLLASASASNLKIQSGHREYECECSGTFIGKRVHEREFMVLVLQTAAHASGVRLGI